MTYRLDDVVQRHRAEPNAFSIPRAAVRHSLQVGEIVSVGLVPEEMEMPEWVWLRTEIVRDGGRYIGTLLNKPQSIAQLEEGYRVEFTADNVLTIYIEEGDERWIDRSKLAMVSGYVVEGPGWPGRLMRIPPHAEEYSGWFIFSGTEPPDYIKDFTNFSSQPLSALIDAYPNLDTVLASPFGAEWRWDPEAFEYCN